MQIRAAGTKDEVISMEEEYWRRFLKTGEIRDYLYYKGLSVCRRVMDRYTRGISGKACPGRDNEGAGCPASYESGGSSESDYSNGHGACSGAGR